MMRFQMQSSAVFRRSSGCPFALALGTVLALVVLGSTSALAKVIAVERAEYGTTTSINGLNGGYGWASAWSGNNNVVAGSLTRASVPTAGQRFSTDANNVASFRLLATAGNGSLLTPSGEFGKEGTTMWVSCLMRRDADSPAGSGRYAGLSLFHNGGAEELLIGVPWEAANWGIHVHDLGASAPGLSSTAIVNGSTVWLVVRLTFGVSGTSDRVELFVNPNPTVTPTTPSVTKNGANIQFTLLRLASGSTTTAISVDELRVGTTWEDVSPAFEQDFGLPLGTAPYHSVGIFKKEHFTQTSAGAPTTADGARFDAYTLTRPPPIDGLIGGLFSITNKTWELTCLDYQTIEPIIDFEKRHFYLEPTLFHFPPPPAVDYANRAALEAVWPDHVYAFDLQTGHIDPVLGFMTDIVGVVLMNVVTEGYTVPTPVVANFERLQAWPRTLPVEIQWQPFVGATKADFVQVFLQRDHSDVGFTRVVTPLAGEPGVIPASATHYADPEPSLTTTNGWAEITFFNVTRINTTDYPGCLGISGVSRQTTVSIHYVDPIIPTISIEAAQHGEGTGAPETLTCEVRLSRPSNTQIFVDYATADETARAGEDYQATSGQLVFKPGETVKTISIPLLADSLAEPNETLMVALSSPVIGVLGQSQAQVTIVDDDGGGNAAPRVEVALADTNGIYGTPVSFSLPAGAFADPDAGQTLTYAASGLPAGVVFDPIAQTFSGAPQTVGSHPVQVTATDNGSPPLSTDDTFAFVIAPAPLMVNANSVSRLQGDPSPALSGTLVGVVNGDNISAVFRTTATAASAPGTYPVFPEWIDPDARLGNYSVTTNLGTLTVVGLPALVVGPVANSGWTLSWPAGPAGFVLESAEVLSQEAVWHSVTSGIAEEGGRRSYQVTTELALPSRFYRLRRE